MEEKFINLANDLQVIASVWNERLMLELRGAFSPKRVVASKVLLIADNVKAISKIIDDNDDGMYTVTGGSVLYQKASASFNVSMLEIRMDATKPAKMSVNVVNAVIRHAQELKRIIADNSPKQLQEEKITRATKDLEKNESELPKDKKSARDPQAQSIDAPSLSPTSAQVRDYLINIVKVSEEDATFFQADSDAIKAFQAYSAQLKAKFAAPPKKESYADMIARNKADADAGTLANVATVKAESKRGKGIPVTFSVRVVKQNKVSQQTLAGTSMSDARDRVLLGMELAHKSDSAAPTKMIDTRPDGTSGSAYFKSLVSQGYVFDVKHG